MNSKNIFYITLILSVIVQVITGLIDIVALFYKVPSQYMLIHQLIVSELTVQVIESSFYFWLLLNFKEVADITPKRYIDWSITTPTMLITLILYLIYLNNREKGDTSKLEFFDLIGKNASIIISVVLLNLSMLIFGYLGEKKIIPTITGVILGFIPFVIYYFIIYINYVRTQLGFNLFLYFVIFWSLYGVAALFPYYLKNASYNILDLFAKNFFGLFLAYIILSGNY